MKGFESNDWQDPDEVLGARSGADDPLLESLTFAEIEQMRELFEQLGFSPADIEYAVGAEEDCLDVALNMDEYAKEHEEGDDGWLPMAA